VITVLATGVPILLLAGTRNGMAEFCTTQAYGWPIPMRYDYCPCASMMGKDPAPAWPIAANGIVVLAAGFLVQGIAWRVRGKRP